MTLASGIWCWADRIDPDGTIPPEARVTMGEGPTPLVSSTSIGPQAGIDLWFLDLTGQPTLSYKAAFAAAAISLLPE
jgi:threonine synthase